MNFELKPLPVLGVDLETKNILKKCATANRYLAELKGISGTIPNQQILINTLSIQEAKDSSEIENIITTHDELFKTELFPAAKFINPAAKEVSDYVSALRKGYELVKQNDLLTTNNIIDIQSALERNNSGIRKLPGTVLKNEKTGEIIYTPPQNYYDVIKLLDNLVRFINDDELLHVDDLIKMALIHYQFESIHPFYDGNGRTGRIINVLYLVLKNMLDIPVLYLSRYIVQNKKEYYSLLQEVRDKDNWESWILFMLDAIENTSKQTITKIQEINEALMSYKHQIRAKYKFYSQDLINNLFFHPYTKIEFIQKSLKITRLTATKYLDELTKGGFLNKEKIGRSNYYINIALFRILSNNI
ncbi:MAG: Fic family protein [Candidatus Delongbacteria bacterium]|nr:Fic family protein [Candidatus Delongbacteria bacterium]